MTLDSLLAEIRAVDHQFTVYADDPPMDVEEWFANHRVEVTHEPLPSAGPPPFLVVEREGEFAGVIGLAELERLLEPPVVRPAAHEELSAGYRTIFEILDDTVFTSMSRRELVTVSREIEDRARRVGSGTLHAGFQSFSVFRPQIPVYRELGSSGVEVHVHGEPDWTPPELPGTTYHARTDGITKYWLLAFDGGAERTQACGLLAVEESDGYTGFWTDDESIVTEIERGVATTVV